MDQKQNSSSSRLSTIPVISSSSCNERPQLQRWQQRSRRKRLGALLSPVREGTTERDDSGSTVSYAESSPKSGKSPQGSQSTLPASNIRPGSSSRRLGSSSSSSSTGSVSYRKSYSGSSVEHIYHGRADSITSSSLDSEPETGSEAPRTPPSPTAAGQVGPSSPKQLVKIMESLQPRPEPPTKTAMLLQPLSSLSMGSSEKLVQLLSVKEGGKLAMSPPPKPSPRPMPEMTASNLDAGGQQSLGDLPETSSEEQMRRLQQRLFHATLELHQAGSSMQQRIMDDIRAWKEEMNRHYQKKLGLQSFSLRKKVLSMQTVLDFHEINLTTMQCFLKSVEQNNDDDIARVYLAKWRECVTRRKVQERLEQYLEIVMRGFYERKLKRRIFKAFCKHCLDSCQRRFDEMCLEEAQAICAVKTQRSRQSRVSVDLQLQGVVDETSQITRETSVFKNAVQECILTGVDKMGWDLIGLLEGKKIGHQHGNNCSCPLGCDCTSDRLSSGHLQPHLQPDLQSHLKQPSADDSLEQLFEIVAPRQVPTGYMNRYQRPLADNTRRFYHIPELCQHVPPPHIHSKYHQNCTRPEIGISRKFLPELPRVAVTVHRPDPNRVRIMDYTVRNPLDYY